ncbi:MAG TPA: hypothetical protein VK968_02880, partial [Roseimicrobium sp.]|nr:hypothetical protein [Roseimicrobium sp.]
RFALKRVAGIVSAGCAAIERHLRITGRVSFAGLTIALSTTADIFSPLAQSDAANLGSGEPFQRPFADPPGAGAAAAETASENGTG